MIDTKTAAEKLNITPRRVRVLCEQGRIRGAKKVGRDWLLPPNPVVLAAERRRPGKAPMRD